MTDQRDLKRRIRERMARTGESYTTARTHVLAQRTPSRPSLLVEPLDLAEHTARLGLRCSVRMFPALAEHVDPAIAVERLRDALLGTEDDPATEVFRAAVFRGKVPPTNGPGDVEALRRFLTRAQAGLGGISEGGRMLALHVQTELVLCTLAPTRTEPDVPVVWLRSPRESIGSLKIGAWGAW